jgi:ribosome recycling factor
MAATTPEQILAYHKTECDNAIQALKRELQRFRTGRASPGLLDSVVVDYYGSKTQLMHLAQISTPEPRLIVVQVYDASATVSVEKAIQNAGLGLNPSREGNTLRITVPPLTEESRRELVKRLHKLAEEVRVSARNHRRDANDLAKKLEKDSGLPKDEVSKLTEKIQKQTDATIVEVDKLIEAKEAECLAV